MTNEELLKKYGVKFTKKEALYFTINIIMAPGIKFHIKMRLIKKGFKVMLNFKKADCYEES